MDSYLVVLCALVFFNEVAYGCTSGFMELDILRKRAEKIPGQGTSDQGLDNEFRLLPGESFSCCGNMTGLLLVGAVRRIIFLRKVFPEIQLWRNTGGNTYTRQASEEIRLTEGDFSPDGVLQYNLTTPIAYQSGDVLGVYQPRDALSVVRVYYSNDLVTTYRQTSQTINRPSSVDLPDLSSISDQQILISPISDSPCTGNFLSRSALRQGALDVNINDVRIRDNQRLFPDITFTCNGSITKWIVGMVANQLENDYLLPELQIWRNYRGTSYTKAGFSLVPTNVQATSNVVEFIPNPPLEFQEGDILGVYQPRRDDSALVVYYQKHDGPVNYLEGNSALSTVTLGDPDDDYDYPLVTVEINTQIVPIQDTTTTTTISNISNSSVDTTSATPLTVQETSMIIIPALIAPVVLLILATAIVIIILIWLSRKCRESHHIKHSESNDIEVQPNISYNALCVNKDSIDKQHYENNTECHVYSEVRKDGNIPVVPVLNPANYGQNPLNHNECYTSSKNNNQPQWSLWTEGNGSTRVQLVIDKQGDTHSHNEQFTEQIELHQSVSVLDDIELESAADVSLQHTAQDIVLHMVDNIAYDSLSQLKFC